jgi:hypothetical protein
MNSACEACEQAAWEVTEPTHGEGAPFRVCAACHRRLHEQALRPREWYNLAKRHGWWPYALHDDFYEEDGTACQPDGDVELPDLYPAPTLGEVSRDP